MKQTTKINAIIDNNAVISLDQIINSAVKFQKVILKYGTKAFLRILSKMSDKEAYKAIKAKIKSDGLPFSILAHPNDAILFKHMFEIVGINSIEIKHSNFIESGRPVFSWVVEPKFEIPPFLNAMKEIEAERYVNRKFL